MYQETINSSRPNTSLHQSRDRENIQTRPTPPVTPIYADASTQTIVDNPPQPLPTKRKPYISLSQRLLTRSHLRIVRSETRTIEDMVQGSIDPFEVPWNPSPPAIQPRNSAFSSTEQATVTHDMEMMDSEPPPPRDPEPVSPQAAVKQASVLSFSTQTPLQSSHPPIKPPAPPWPSTESHIHIDEQRHHLKGHRPAGLHVDLPPPRLFNSASFTGNFISATPGPLSASAFQSPLSTSSLQSLPGPSFMSPVTSAAKSITQPSPVRKKMSLSDYMNKKKTPALEKTQSYSQQGMSGIAGIGQSLALSTNPGSEGSENASGSLDCNGVRKEASGGALKPY